ncbi:PadR family transcriptional regulator [Agromyces protaetiae]|uniref:PadR family transcriptional regulator n=1 Tax=Agromyces protaetiae TaxID=2509455 RepID=A0A4P6FFB7_9MICO|nr:PadR family transcriptional regulator [Agromyces protaetiae]QAY74635.1 PadR family transcriptional regulator [Agromyces protaetiae]
MSASYTGGGFGARSFGGGRFGSGEHLREAIDQFRSMFEQRVGGFVGGAGDLRAAILALLAEGPRSGSQVISDIEQRSGGWKPSASSVYPTLQLLADEGLVTAEASDDRKVYSLTDAGKAQADASGGAPWEASGGSDVFGAGPLAKAGIDLAHAAAQVRRTGTPEQVEEAVAVLDDARRKLYSILAQG